MVSIQIAKFSQFYKTSNTLYFNNVHLLCACTKACKHASRAYFQPKITCTSWYIRFTVAGMCTYTSQHAPIQVVYDQFPIPLDFAAEILP